MNTLTSIFDWILAASLRASLLALAVPLIQLALRKHLPPRWRYALWLPVLIVLVLPILPESRWSAENLWAVFVEKALVVDVTPMPERVTAATSAPWATLPETSVPAAFTWKELAACTWVAGALSVLVCGLGCYGLALRRFKRSSVPADAALMEQIAGLCEELRVRPPRTLIASEVESPAVAGVLRPLLLLPASFPQSFTSAEAALVLKHELMHLKRRDLPMNALTCLVLALHWFNPLLWLAASRSRLDREAACDAQVLDSSERDCRNDYGHALLKVETTCGMRGFSLGFVGIFQRGRALRSRIQAIANYKTTHPLTGLAAAAAIVLLTAFGATSAASKKNDTTRASVAVEIHVIEITRKPGQEITLSPGTQACAASEVQGDRHGGPLLVSAAEFAAFKQAAEAYSGVKSVQWPRMVTADRHNILIRSVVNRPVPDAGKIAYLPIGMLCEVLPKIRGERIDIDCDLKFSELRDAGASKRLETATSLAEAEKQLNRVAHQGKIRFQPGQTAIISMRWPELPGAKRERLQLVAITPAFGPRLPADVEAQSPAPAAASGSGSGIHLAAAPAPSSEAPSAATALVVRTFSISSGFAAKLGVKNGNLKGALEAHGIAFPGEARVALIGPESKQALIMRNTPKNLEAVAALLDRLGLATVHPPADSDPGRPAAPVVGQGGDRADSIILPSVEFVDTPLTDAVKFLQAKALEHDPDKKGVTVTILGKPSAAVKITLSLKSVPLSEAVRYTAELTNMKVQSVGDGYVLVPAK